MSILSVLYTFATTIVVAGMVYYVWTLSVGTRVLRRAGFGLGHQRDLRYGRPHAPAPPERWFVYFLIPALNEEAVIAATVTALRGGARSHVVVVDDGSDDATGELARSSGADEVTVIRRDLPVARLGKGRALNAGYRWILDDIPARHLRCQDVVVCVMDADGRLSDGALSQVLPHFDDPAVGAVQLPVRIRNRQRFLAGYQDHAFFGIAAVGQFARVSTGSVSLGGNGQFSRLEALESLDDEPWSDSLTEDLDLGIRLNLRGWATTATLEAAVDQQGVNTVRALVRQRTRWYQGHMACGREIPAVWRCRALPNRRALELATYLAVPWMVLPWSIFFHLGVALFVLRLATGVGMPTGLSPYLVVLIWYVLSFLAGFVNGYVYYRRDPSVGWWRPLAFAQGVVSMDYLSFLAAWRAFFRLVRGKRTWAKTVREQEGSAVEAGVEHQDGLTPAAKAVEGDG